MAHEMDGLTHVEWKMLGTFRDFIKTVSPDAFMRVYGASHRLVAIWYIKTGDPAGKCRSSTDASRVLGHPCA